VVHFGTIRAVRFAEPTFKPVRLCG